MYGGATLFLDVGVQSDFWPGGAWPVMLAEQAGNVTALFALAGEHRIRQGGVVCRHDATSDAPPAAGAARHCMDRGAGRARPDGCTARMPMWITTADESAGDTFPLDRTRSLYVDSGCGVAPDADPLRARAFSHLVSGVRDAVVFGAGVEHGIDLAVAALLRRRVRVHVALDALATVNEEAAQLVVAGWKRRGVDGTTVGMVARALRRG